MYCRNCGKEIQDMAVVCVNCGCPKGEGKNFCPTCGNPVTPGAVVCLKCGTALTAQMQVDPATQKSKLAAGLLGIFLGGLGIHNFYLGYTKKAIAQVVLFVAGLIVCGIPTLAAIIWGLIEGIMILSGSIKEDSQGIPLKE